ncbi:MAG: rhodanese-related sulfurtransferase [Pseudomonadota bacterium]
MKVAAFYRFLDLRDPQGFRDELDARCRPLDLLGTVLIANEGINGTLAGEETALRALLDYIEQRLELDHALDVRWTDSGTAPFRRLRVKLKKEIVTLGRPDILPHRGTGKHVPPEQWNALLDDPDVLLIDTRNHYEVEVGSFPGAADPGTDSFREFPEYAQALAESSPDRPLAMFCTGGIRCEKATALMLELGFGTVYHLEGGILNYLDTVPEEDKRWNGECFVFDTRVAVDRDLAEGGYVQCHACRRPLGSDDLASPDYREGVSCPRCVNETDEDKRARLAERAKQVRLATERGERHVGARLKKSPEADAP